MKKFVLLLLFATLIPATMMAQMEIRPNGQTVIGDRFYKVLQSSGDHVVFDPVYATYETEIDEDASMVVLGPEENGAWGYMTFGDGWNLGIGEFAPPYMSTPDTNILELYSSAGLVYTPDGRMPIFNYTYSSSNENPFTFFTEVTSYGFNVTSDMRLKKDVEKLDKTSCSGIFDIQPISYRLTAPEGSNSDNTAAASATKTPRSHSSRTSESCTDERPPRFAPNDRIHYGFSAQEVQKIFPELVTTDKDGYLSIDYISFIPMLMEAVQGLNEKVEAQEARIEELEAVIADNVTAPKKMAAGVDGVETVVASMGQNRPNPFSVSSTIDITLPHEVKEAYVYVYDLQGTQVMKLEVEGRGSTSVTVEGNRLKAGMYIYSLIADDGEVDTKRMILTD